MNWVKQILSAVKGESGTGIADAAAIARFEQALNAVREALRHAEHALTVAKADELGLRRKVEADRVQIALRRRQARLLLGQGGHDLAKEVAEDIARLQADLQTQEGELARTGVEVAALLAQINEAQRGMETLERELNIVRTTEAVNKADTYAPVHGDADDASTGSAAIASLKRVQERQRQRRAQPAVTSVSGQEGHRADSLDAKLQAAGVGAAAISANDILAELKAEVGVDNEH